MIYVNITVINNLIVVWNGFKRKPTSWIHFASLWLWMISCCLKLKHVSKYVISSERFNLNVITKTRLVWRNKLLKLNRLQGVSFSLPFSSFRDSICLCSGEACGALRAALLTEDILPLEMTYTLQKSGAPFNMLLGVLVLNLHLVEQRWVCINHNIHAYILDCSCTVHYCWKSE